MSTTIDQRVVEMRFDNKQFESNVSNTMSTLDKLKQKLNFKDASKGLDSVSNAAKNVNMNGLGTAVDTVHAKFSALEVMGVTALANITNSAVNAGKRIVSALTIDPIKTGFQEYETQINAVQTILANTESKGSTIDDVNRALEELNKYADMTIYNFTEMTRNIGTFTAAGVDLDTSTNAIKGIANLAAVSGSTSQQASTAMYQLSQALASGTVKLMDWNSVVNAGMGGQVFQDALKETARVHGVAIDSMIEEQGSFRETLSEGWLTSEILTDTLQKFTLTTEGLTEEQIEANREMLRAKGYTEDQIDGIFKLGNTATNAATKVKTFTQLWDVLKESAQSGWAQTWKLLVGDFEEAKALFTPLSEFLTGIINGMSEARNAVLESALGKGFTKAFESVSEIFNTTSESVEKVTSALDNLDEIVNDTILGKFGNGEDRFNAMTEAGINFYQVQNKVNETLGDSFRYTEEQIAEQDKLLGIQKETTEATGEQEKVTAELTEEQKNELKLLAQMDEAQLRSKGYTDEQIQALKDLGEQADKLGMDLGDFIDNLDQINGRWLLINSFKNIGKGLIDVFKAIGEAWSRVFPPRSVEERATSLFNLIAAFHKLTSSLVGVIYNGDELTETGENLVRTLQGVFAIIDIVATVAGGVLKTAFKVVVEILKRFDLNILDVTAAVGDAIVSFRDFIDSIFNVSGIVDFLIPIIKKAAEFISEFINAVKNSKWLGVFADYLRRIRIGLGEMFGNISDIDEFKNLMKVLDDARVKIKEWVETLKGSENIPADIIAGLAKGIREGAPEIIAAVFDLGWSIITGICKVLGIASPAKEMIAVGEYTVDGLVLGIQNGAATLKDTVIGIGTKIVEWFKSIDFGTLFAVGVGTSAIVLTSKIGNALNILASPLAGLGDMFEEIGDGAKTFLKGLGSYFKANAWEARAKAMLSFAGAVAILAASVYVLAQLDAGKLWSAVGAITVLAAVIGALSVVVSKMGSSAGFKDFFSSIKIAGLGMALMGLSVVLLAIAYVVKKIGELNPEQAKQGFLGLAGVVGAIAAVFAAYGLLVKGKSAQNINKVGGMLIKLSIAMLLLVGVAKLVSGLSEDEMIKGAAAMGAFVVFVGLLSAASRLAGKQVDKLGGMLIKVSIALGLMVGVVKLINTLTEDEMDKGVTVLGVFIVFIGILTAITSIAGGNKLDKVGSTILSIAGAMLLMTIVGKMISGMTWADMGKAAAGIAGLGLIIAGLIFVMSKYGDGNDLKRVGTTLLMASIAIGILAGVVALLGLLNVAHLAKGLVAVTILGAVMAGMIWASRGASNCTGNLIAMTVAIGLMAAAVAALSLIETGDLIKATLALSMVMGMFALMIKVAGQAQLALGGLIVMAGVVAILGGLLYLLAGLPIEGTIAAALSLSTLLLALTVSLKILSTVQTVSPMALVAVGVMTLIVGLLGGILYLLKDLPVESTLATAQSLSILLLSMSAALGILTLVGSAWPAALAGIGCLAAFVVAIGALIVGIGALVEKFPQLEEFLDTGIPILDKIGNALGSFFGNIISGFAEGLTDGFPDIATNLSTFMTNLQPFIDGAKSFDETAMTGVKNIADSILSLAGANLVDTITQWLPGDNSLASIGEQLVAFGTAIKDYSTEVSGLDMEAITTSVTAAKEIVDVAKSIPSDGLFGTDGIDDFGRNVKTFGECIKAYAEEVAEINTTAVTTSVAAAKSLVEVANTIPDDGTFGTDGIDDFGSNIKSFAKALKKYSDEASEISLSAITSSVLGVHSLIGAINSTTTVDASGVDTFKKAVNSLSKVNVDGVVKAFDGASSRLKAVGAKLFDGIASGMTSRQSLLAKTVTSATQAMLKAIDSQKVAFKAAGIELMSNLINGVLRHKTRLSTTMSSAVKAAATSARASYDSFYSAGSYLVDGFAAGISANSFKAAAKAKAMANAAEKAAKEALDINSPSKVFRAIGYSVPEGFAMGIDKLSGMAEVSAVNMGNAAVGGIRESISRMADAMNADMDVAPTIRPLLDLSDVKSGASTIGSLLNAGSSVGVLSNVSSINTMMNRRSQNGVDSEIVSAINKLRKDVGNMDRNAYSIGNITYDDGSQISETIKTLARAVVRERRV